MKLNDGQRIDHYTVLGELGRGGMSDVYRARDERDEREVVLKTPHEDMMGDPATYERFCREVKIGKTLSHPNIQQFYELEGDTLAPYLVLEYVPGQTMRDYLRAGGSDRRERHLPVEEAVSLGLELARALAHAHAHGVFHRDLKPENVIVTPDGHAKVMDFGIGFVEGSRRVTWGPLSSQVGTPDYMAPEQIQGTRGDQRTDIYALGMMLYECLAGRLPYEGDNPLAVMNQHVTVSAPSVRRFCRDVPAPLEEMVMKAIRRDPRARWQNMDEFAAALDHPETLDVEALRAEREIDEASTRRASSIHGEFGLPLWKVGAVILGVLGTLVALGVAAQLAHGPK